MTDDLDRSLRRATVWRDEDLDTPQVREALTAMRDSIKAEPAADLAPKRDRTRRRRRWAAAIAAAITVPGIALGTPAAADWISLHTGRYSNAPGEVRTADDEYWRINSPEAADKLRAYAREYGMAPGYSIEPLVKIAAESPDAQMPARGFRGWVAGWSECSWTLTAADARDRGDRRTQVAAGKALRELATVYDGLYRPDESNAAEYARLLATDVETGRSEHLDGYNENTCREIEKTRR